MDRDVYGTNLKRHGRLITCSWLPGVPHLESSAFQDRRNYVVSGAQGDG
jgi:hypothetical protein